MQATHPQLIALSTDIAAIAKTAAPSTVAIQAQGQSCSGFFWRPDVVATASDLLEASSGEKVSLTSENDKATQGVVIGRDPTTDLALIRASEPGTALASQSSSGISLGQAVIALGRTGHGPTCAVGFVALAGGPWRSMRGGEISRRIWLDLSMLQQCEGGAVLDTTGGLLGMAVFGPHRRIVLIPADTIERVGQDILAHGRVRRGYLGVSVQPIALSTMPGADAGGRATGLMILSLDAQGPAAAAGLLQGDIVRAIDGEAVRSSRALSRKLPPTSIGQAVTLDLVRAGVETKLTVAIGESPAR
jgi:S1-C subfamily serine protease